MHLVNCLEHLCKYLPYGLLRQIPSVFDDGPEEGIQITTFTMLHNQIDVHCSLVKDVFIVLDNVCALKFS
jgi:hypothetical protein